MKAQGGYRFWFQKNNRILSCAFFLFIFLFFTNVSAHGPAAIKKFVKENFDPTTPGLTQHLKKLWSLGVAFELETAISLLQQDKNCVIKGFGLEIAFDISPAHISVFGDEQKLASTEFDIITESTKGHNGMAIECKCLKPLDPIKNILQLQKEQMMLLWMQSLRQDLVNNQLRMKFIFKHPLARKIRPRILLIGPSTRNQYIMLWASWIDLKKRETPEEQFINIINLLATKELVTYYQEPIGSFAERLDDLGIPHEDEVDMDEPGALAQIDTGILAKELEQLGLTGTMKTNSYLCLADLFQEATTCIG